MPQNDAFNSDGGFLRLSSDVCLVEKDGSESRLFSPCSSKRSSSSSLSSTQQANTESTSSLMRRQVCGKKDDELYSPLSIYSHPGSFFSDRVEINKPIVVPSVFKGKELLFKDLSENKELVTDILKMQKALEVCVPVDHGNNCIAFSQSVMRRVTQILLNNGIPGSQTYEIGMMFINEMKQKSSEQCGIQP